MAHYRPIHRGVKLLAVDFERQILPSTFEHALRHLVDHELDLESFHQRYKNDAQGAAAYDPSALLKIILLAYSRGIMETVLPDAQLGEAGTSWVCRMKGLRMLPNTKTHTVLPVSGSFQGVERKPKSGNDENARQPFRALKKMTARSGWDDQIQVFLHPR